MLSKQIIEEKIRNVPYNHVEDIISEISYNNGRGGLVHRELNDFNNFVDWFIWGKKEQYTDNGWYCPYNWKFKDDFYENFDNNGDNKEDLIRWCCLYWIHETEYVDDTYELEDVLL